MRFGERRVETYRACVRYAGAGEHVAHADVEVIGGDRQRGAEAGPGARETSGLGQLAAGQGFPASGGSTTNGPRYFKPWL